MAYVYRHIRVDKNEPFYIGIGKEETRAYSKHNRNPHWNSIVNLTDYVVDILFDDLDYEAAKEKEIELIQLYKRCLDGGTLCNITLGGQGNLGLVHTKEAKTKMSAANIGKAISKEQRESVSRFHKGKKLSEEHKEKISLAQRGDKHHMYGKKHGEKTKKKMSIARRGELNKTSKLTNETVFKIRELYEMGDTSSRKLAKLFNVSKVTILGVVNRKTWKHI